MLEPPVRMNRLAGLGVRFANNENCCLDDFARDLLLSAGNSGSSGL